MAVQSRPQCRGGPRRCRRALAVAVDDEVAGVDAEHAHGVGDEPLQPGDLLIDDCDAARARGCASDASDSAGRDEATFIDVSGVLNSCARASRTVARSSPLCRAASARAVA